MEGMVTTRQFTILVQGFQLSPPSSVQVQCHIARNATTPLVCSQGVSPYSPHTPSPHARLQLWGQPGEANSVSSAASGCWPGPYDVEKSQQEGGQEHCLWQQQSWFSLNQGVYMV